MLQSSVKIVGTDIKIINSKRLRLNVGVMIINRESQILVCQRIDNTRIWQMPQGGVMPNEHLITAAYRELKEETGIVNVQFLSVSKKFYAYEFGHVKRRYTEVYEGQKQKWFLFLFLGDAQEINVQQKHQEFIAWKWIVHTELKNTGHTKSKIYVQVLEEFLPTILLSRQLLQSYHDQSMFRI